MNTLKKIILGAALSCATGAAFAQPPESEQSPADQPPADQQPPHRHHGPPPEALAACKSATSGQQCSFTSRRGDPISGTCVSREEGKPLACRPSHPPGAGGEQPGSTPPPKP